MDFIFDLQRFATTINGGQLAFGATSDGLFTVNITTKTDGAVTLTTSVQAQTSAQTYAAPTSGYKYFLPVSNVYDSATGLNVLTFGAVEAYDSTGIVNEEATQEINEAIATAAAAGTYTGTITATATTGQAIALDVSGVNATVNLKNVDANSVLNLKSGDTVTTASLSEGDQIIIGTAALEEESCTITATNVYTAAASGTMTIKGDGAGATLYAGTVKLTATTEDEDVTAAELITSGATTGSTDNMKVTTTDTDGLTVKVGSGKVSSITGLNGGNAVVTSVATATAAGVTVYTATITTYTTLNDGNTMVAKAVQTGVSADSADAAVAAAGIADAVTTYADIKLGGEVYTASYKTASYNAIGAWGDGSAAETNKVIYYLGASADTDVTETNIVTAANAEADDSPTARGLDTTGKKFQAIAGEYYLQVTSTVAKATTTKPATVTISGFQLMQGNAAGALTNVSTSTAAYEGTLTYDANGLAVNFTKSKTADYNVTISNAHIASKFTNLEDGDSVTTYATGYTDLTAGTYTVYNAGAVTNTVTIAGGKVNVTVAAGAVSDIDGLNKGETVTLVTYAEAGTTTRKIQATSDTKVTITDTDAAGKVSVYTDTIEEGVASVANWVDYAPTSEATESIVAKFDWTKSNSTVGYFAVSGNDTSATATVKNTATTTTITSSSAAKRYVTVTLGEEEDGVTAVTLDAKMNDGITMNDTTFTGTLTINAPSTAINLAARGVDATTLKITNLAAGSTIAAVAMTGEKDTVTTAKLTDVDSVMIAGTEYVGAGTAITATTAGLYSGTVTVGEATSVIVGDYTISNTNEDGTTAITVTATGGKTFSLGSLDDGDKVTILDASEEAPLSGTFTKHGNYLYSDDNKMYALSGNTISYSNLDTSKSAWKTAVDVSGNPLITNVVNLSLADTAMKSDDDAAYSFVRDKYMTAAPTKATNVTATVTAAASDAYDVTVGSQTAAGTKAYLAAENVDQTINVTSDWTVTANGGDTIINGAASGTDTLVGGAGDDTFNLKGATDTVNIAEFAGADTISGYAAKDSITLHANAQYTLSTTTGGDVYAASGVYVDGTTSDYVLLKGVGSTGVTINGDVHYFGNGKTATTGGSFTYADGAYYHGNTSGKNTLKVGTLKDALSKTNSVGEAISINLAADANYENIDIVDASSSANVVALTASAGGSTLKGGTYVSFLTGGAGDDTLVGGTGADTFVLGGLAEQGDDTIQNYTAGKDTLTTTVAVTAANFSASGSDVVLTADPGDEDSATVTIENAAGKAITLEQTVDDTATIKTIYVGKSTAANTFTVSSEPGANDIYVGAADYTDTIKLSYTQTEFVEPAEGDNNSFTFQKYQGGTVDMTNYSSIEAVDASGVKVSSALVSEYGSKFSKYMGGVSVTAGTDGTTFTGSAFDDLFTCGDGNDTYITNTSYGNDIIAGLGVGDVIQINGLTTAEKTVFADYNSDELKEALTTGISFSSGGSLKVTNAAEATYTYSDGKITVSGNN